MRLHPRSIDLGLERIERLLKALDSPEKKLPPIVHVAGTNGKGSLVAYLRAMAEAAGYRVHVYTSPHLVRFNERIRVAGRIIGDGELDEILTECEQANAEQPITFFEITTVAAYLAFARVPADLAIDAEIERLKPLVELGGYIPCPDHRIPLEAEWDLVRYYCDRMRATFAR